ncbi:MAG: adenylyl-sulfate kinase [Candidatus Dojkabacteria bacterium]|nr:adenylyl-sulfate kinase [Candidatus Dojkabacteria bacterium]
MLPKSQNITKIEQRITKQDKEKLLGQKGAVYWMTGLSGSGKSTIAVEVERILYEQDKLVTVLDGDNVRYGLNADLGFSEEDRRENLRRIAEVAKLFAENGIIVITSFISPTKASRKKARQIISQSSDFHEIYVKCRLTECEKRDPKGLYKKARTGEIKEFTGIDSPFEEPENAELVIETDSENIDKSVQKLLEYIKRTSITTV